MQAKERIKLSDHFDYKKLLRFVFPSVVMMVFISVYSIVDGLFVSNFAGEIPFAALNLIFPFIMILGAVGFMLGTGGNAVISKALGEGDNERANRIFSMLVYTTVVIGGVVSVIGITVAPAMARLFAKTEKNMSAQDKQQLISYCTIYARIILAALPGFMLQNAFQGFFVTAEKPRLGLFVTLFAGVGNVLLDALFVAVFKWGLAGAALATAINQLVGGILPILYFARKNDSLLRLGKTSFDGKVLLRVCFNGMSELIANISMSLVTILYNAQLMRIVGIAGVSAYGIMQYIGFIFIGMFIGYAVGTAPIIGYHYGAKNHGELKNILRKSVILTLFSGVCMALICAIFARVLASVFVSYDEQLLRLTTHGLRVYSIAFLVCGVNIFISAFFTALSNGAISLFVSVARTCVFQVSAVLLLPIWLGVTGVWLSLGFSEICALLLSVFLLIRLNKNYHYL